MSPTVSFVVPCYKLAHLLPECVESILNQTYTDFEVLIMDDCSPDNTPEVAQSFKDPRVRHVRNDPNLGHLRNYNKGIDMATGKYVWLISADDRLRKHNVLGRYVALMEGHPNVGYAFGWGVAIVNGEERPLSKDFWWGDRDEMFSGRSFLSELMARRGGVLAPSVMVRKTCYDVDGNFPTDMPHQADLYLWCIWALRSDVAYVAEAVVGYRLHDLSMMSTLKRNEPKTIIADQLSVQWRVRKKAEESGHGSSVQGWLSNLRDLYAYCLISEAFGSSPYRMSFEEFEESLSRYSGDSQVKRVVRASVYAGFADGCYKHKQFTEAVLFYRRSLRENAWLLKVWLKLLLLRIGSPGIALRNRLVAHLDVAFKIKVNR